MLSDFNFETRFGILSSWRIFLTSNLKKIENFIFCPPIEFPKLQRFCADPYTSQIELKFRIQCFGTIRQLLRHGHFALSKKRCFSLHPTQHTAALKFYKVSPVLTCFDHDAVPVTSFRVLVLYQRPPRPCRPGVPVDQLLGSCTAPRSAPVGRRPRHPPGRLQPASRRRNYAGERAAGRATTTDVTAVTAQHTAALKTAQHRLMNFFATFTAASARPFDCEHSGDDTRWVTPHCFSKVWYAAARNCGPPSLHSMLKTPV